MYSLLHRYYSTLLEWKWRIGSLYTVVTRGGGHMFSEKSQRTQNGTMFVDLDWPLNASRRLSASAELLVYFTAASHLCVFFGNNLNVVSFWGTSPIPSTLPTGASPLDPTGDFRPQTPSSVEKSLNYTIQ